MSVHAPYHFVPLSKWVYMPDWAHIVSHDVPLEQGLSGSIDYCLRNKTPLLIGGEKIEQQNAPALLRWVRDVYDNPVVPGSSVKGMLRNVLEIASFGKFSAIDENHFSFRSVTSNSKYLDSVIQPNTVRAAWIKFDEVTKRWTMVPCEWAKVRHSDIKAKIGKDIRNEQLAINKYATIPLMQSVTMTPKAIQGKRGSVIWAKELTQGDTVAHFVFCNKRIIGRGEAKDYEFSYCFYGHKSPINIDAAELNEKVKKCFTSHGEEQVEYLIRHQHPELGIPVFALFEKGSNKLHSIGLSKMPRVLYKQSVSQVADSSQAQARTSAHSFDMAELLFGTLREKGLSLKSRIAFSEARLTKNKGLVQSDSVVLNGPKATFKAAYLEQKPGNHLDYDDKTARLAGWKRYVAQTEFKENPSGSDNNAVKTQLELLNAGSEFSGKIVFHNLTRAELAALVWCIRLGQQGCEDSLQHGLGHAKSLGAGGVNMFIERINLASYCGSENVTADSLVTEFVSHMNSVYPCEDASWSESPQLSHLLNMCDASQHTSRDLSYMPLSDYQKVNNEGATLALLTQDGHSLERKEPLLNDRASKGFARGRLSDLTIEPEDESWIRAQKQRVEDQLKADKERKLQAALDSMPEDYRDVMQLKMALEKANTLDEKQNLNADVEKLLQQANTKAFSNEAITLLLEAVCNKEFCHYLVINGKKDKKKKDKLKVRQDLVVGIAAHYQITGIAL